MGNTILVQEMGHSLDSAYTHSYVARVSVFYMIIFLSHTVCFPFLFNLHSIHRSQEGVAAAVSV